MAQVYDTGLTTTQRAAIRNALIARLTPLRTTSVPALYLRSIVTVPRPLRSENDKDGQQFLANALLGQAPAVAIAIGKLKTQAGGTDATEADGQLEIAIYIASEHGRDVVEGRLYGDAISAASNRADPGIFTMLEHVRELVMGQPLGIETVAELRPEDEDEVMTAENVTVWEQRYSLLVNISVNPARSVTQLLTSIEDDIALDSVPAPPPFVTTVTEVED